jgi:branched-chain amino acid transport system permease protein
VSLWFIITTGQVPLGHAAFASIGAYMSAAFVSVYELPTVIGLLAAIAVAAIVATIIGYITLRITGIYFLVVTLAFGEIVRIFFGMVERPFGGLNGLMNLPAPDPVSLPGLGVIEFVSKMSLYYLIMIFTLFAAVIIHRLYRSQIGSVHRGISQSDNLAEHVGISIMAYKIKAFVIGSLFAALAGVLYTYINRSILISSFSLEQSTIYLLYVVVGGEAHIAGPIIGAIILRLLSVVLRPIQEFEPIIYGLLLIAAVILFKGGILSLFQNVWQRILATIRKRHMTKIQQNIGVNASYELKDRR